MNLGEFGLAVAHALSLLAAHPFRWAAIMVVFLVVVEGLMFIPYIGFVVKLMLASLLSAQMLALFASAAGGQSPSITSLLSAFSLPWSAQLVLFISALLPFAAGIVFLYTKGGQPAIEFFFGNIMKSKPPAPALFLQFKFVMQLFAVPFTFLAAVVVLKGMTGIAALSAASAAAVTHWLPVLVLFLLAAGFEWLAGNLPTISPKWLAATASLSLLLAFLAWSFAISFTVSQRVFAVAHTHGQSAT